MTRAIHGITLVTRVTELGRPARELDPTGYLGPPPSAHICPRVADFWPLWCSFRLQNPLFKSVIGPVFEVVQYPYPGSCLGPTGVLVTQNCCQGPGSAAHTAWESHSENLFSTSQQRNARAFRPGTWMAISISAREHLDKFFSEIFS